MPFAGFSLLFCCFLLSLVGAALAIPRGSGSVTSKNGRVAPPRLMEHLSLVVFALLTGASFILTAALVSSNFSFLYAVQNTDRGLHLFYRLTALWGGQEGALLFWAWSASLFTVLFQRGKAYKLLSPEPARWFWSLFFAIMGFLCLLLTAWNNPFMEAYPIPADGYGLNPLLQNPGMIFHPPLLFLGYGAFTPPCCLALAALLALKEGGGKREEKPLPWAALARPFILPAWLLLGAGIILGGWWSYMELGWGGYWAWDPVENSSLVPWLVATACLHTSLVENARGKLYRTGAFLMALVLISAFFSTYLVRGGLIRSVHAFGQTDVGPPLLVFTLAFLLFAVLAASFAPKKGDNLDSPLSREGLLTCTAWVFLAIALLTTVATLWPVISLLWSDKAVVLKPAFYNRACLPLFVLLALMLAACPWVGWNGRLRHKPLPLFTALIACASAGSLLYAGFDKPLALLASAAAMAVMAGTCLILPATPGIVRALPSLAGHGVHFGFALMLLGVAFSGPYKDQRDMVLVPGQRAVFGEYTLLLETLAGGDSHDHEPGAGPPAYIYSEAVVRVSRHGKPVGDLRPQVRRYASHPDSTFSEVGTIFSWGNELYCSIIAISENGTTTLQVSVNPLVNWIWAGGVLLCLFPLAGLTGPLRVPSEDGKD